MTSPREIGSFDWVITNPLFWLAEEFVLRALSVARGVANSRQSCLSGERGPIRGHPRKHAAIATRAVEMKTRIRLNMPTACLDQRILRIVLGRIPRLAT